MARTVRAAMLIERELDYVAAARLRGETAAVHHVRRDPAEHRWRRSWSKYRPPRLRDLHRRLPVASSASASSHRRPTGARDCARTTAVIGGYWWTILFDAAGHRLARHRGQPGRRRDRERARRSVSELTRRPSGAARQLRRVASRRRYRCRVRARTAGACATSASTSARASLWPGRRVGLRQVDDRAGHRPLPGRATAGSATGRSTSTAGRAGARARRACASCAPAACRWSTRTRPGAESVDAHRPRRSPRSSRSPALGAQRRASAPAKCSARVRILSPAGDGQLSAPALRRDAAARGDRDGAGVQAGAADPRRADDRRSTRPSKPRCST